jgi:hypothetical protein
MRQVVMEENTCYPREEHKKRVGKPKAHWLINSLKEAHEILNPATEFDPECPVTMKAIHLAATNREKC